MKFHANYWPCVAATFVVGLASSAGGNITSTVSQFVYDTPYMMLVLFLISLAVYAFVANPISIGHARFYLENAYTRADFDKIGFAFQNQYMKNVGILILRDLYIFLWSLLFIVPGIIKTYEYRMIPYLLAENPDLSREDAFRISKEMMNGHKMDTFVLELSFFGWSFLSVLTCYILLIFYVNPYLNATYAELYLALKQIYMGGNGNPQYGQPQNYYGADANGSNQYGQPQNYYGSNVNGSNQYGQPQNYYGSNVNGTNQYGQPQNYYGSNVNGANQYGQPQNYYGSNANGTNQYGQPQNYYGTNANDSHQYGQSQSASGFATDYNSQYTQVQNDVSVENGQSVNQAEQYFTEENNRN